MRSRFVVVLIERRPFVNRVFDPVVGDDAAVSGSVERGRKLGEKGKEDWKNALARTPDKLSVAVGDELGDDEVGETGVKEVVGGNSASSDEG
jgi:hypothetical protein